MSRLLACLSLACMLLLSASLPALAREVRLQGANGDGGACPEAAAADDAVVQPRAKSKRAAIAAPPKAKTGGYHGDDGNAVRAPRWHSFVPGMFR